MMERKKLLTHIILPAAIGGGFIFMVSEPGVMLLFALSARHIPSYEEISDPELIDRTQDLPEVKAFLAHYPNSTVYVQRVDDFAVNYLVRECDVKSEPCDQSLVQGDRYNELKVRLDDNGYPTSSVLWCVHMINGERKAYKIEDNIITRDNIVQSFNRDICLFW
ncbi:MAG: hypothetical protein ACREBU_06080 [Nitrososphaera sp.]